MAKRPAQGPKPLTSREKLTILQIEKARCPQTAHPLPIMSKEDDRRSLGRLRGGHFFCPFLFCRSAIFHAISKAPNKTVKIKLSKLMITAKNVSVSVNVIRHPPFRQSLRGENFQKSLPGALLRSWEQVVRRVRSEPPAFRHSATAISDGNPSVP